MNLSDFFKTLTVVNLQTKRRTLTAKVKRWLSEPAPVTEDMPWWAPQRRVGAIGSLLFIGIVALGGWLFVRALDSDYDDPNKYEQVYYLNNIFTVRKDAVTIEANLFGAEADSKLETHARLLRIHGDQGRVASLDTLKLKYVVISPAEIRPNEPTIRIEKLARQRHLHAALRELASHDLVRYLPPTQRRGAVYSFDLEMEVFRGPESLGLYEETFHFRGDAVVEQSTIFLALLFAGLSLLFIVDFSSIEMDLRWGKLLKAMAMQLAQVLHYLKLPAQVAMEFWDLQPILSLAVGVVLRRVLERIVEQLERLVSLSDQKEVRELHTEAQDLLAFLNQVAGQSPKNEAEFSLWQQSFKNLIARTEKIQQRLLFLGKRPLRFHSKKPPLPLQQLEDALALTHAMVQHGFDNLRAALVTVNARRKERRRLHKAARAQRLTEIAARLNSALQQENLRSDIKKLGENFPRESTPQAIFDTEDVRAEAKTTFVEKKEDLYCDEFSFGVNVSERPQAELVWLQISKTGEEYTLAQASKNKKLKIPGPPSTVVAVFNDKDEEVWINYVIQIVLHRPQANKSTLRFETTSDDLDLIQPKPDPERWFVEIIPPEQLIKGRREPAANAKKLREESVH